MGYKNLFQVLNSKREHIINHEKKNKLLMLYWILYVINFLVERLNLFFYCRMFNHEIKRSMLFKFIDI